MTAPDAPINNAKILALTVRGVTKRFGPTLALSDVDFELAPGEIHALLGENGAGKSTLMNILCGLVRPTQGEVQIAGAPVTLRTPADATRAGIGMVHQHFLLVPSFTVAENLTLAASSLHSRFLLDTQSVIDKAQSVAERLGWSIPMHARISDLPVGTQQRIEILKALLGDAKILLFDEPTAVLAPPEIAELFTVLRALRTEGRSLVFVSHKLGEVMELCDRVTVLRRGKNVGSVAIDDTNPEDLARRMVGDTALVRSMTTELKRNANEEAVKPVLTLERLSTPSQGESMTLKDLSFTLNAGEVLGFAGVDGNGQAELAQVLTGMRPWKSGTFSLEGQTLTRFKPSDLERFGIAYIPPDRHQEGLALSLSVAENLTFEASRLPRFRVGPFLRSRALAEFAAQTAQDFDIRTENLALPVAALSGGNQQKIVIARALWRKPTLLVAVSPTRGLDVAATAYVHQKIRERQSEGGAVVLISTELDEVIALSTRIAVLYEGRIVGIVAPTVSRQELGLMMGGAAHA